MTRLSVSDRQIDNYLQSMPEFQVNGQFSVDRFQEILSSTLLSTSEFLELIRTSLLIDQPKLGIILLRLLCQMKQIIRLHWLIKSVILITSIFLCNIFYRSLL